MTSNACRSWLEETYLTCKSALTFTWAFRGLALLVLFLWLIASDSNYSIQVLPMLLQLPLPFRLPSNTTYYAETMAKILPPQVVEESSLQAGRVKASTIIKPIVYGNVARYFGKKREEDGHTHQWTVYLKPLLNEDMSTWIKKVYFHDPNERPVTLYHVLKLFQTANSSDGSSGPPQPCPSRKALVAETYDEIIFSEPTLHMHQLLTQPPLPVVPGPWRHETDIEAKHKKSLEQILAAKQKIRKEISELKEKIKSTRETIDMFKQQMGQHEPAQS